MSPRPQAAFRPLSAAAVLVAVLALAYQAAVRQPVPEKRLAGRAIAAQPTPPAAPATRAAAPALAPEPCPPHAVIVSEGNPAVRRPWVVRRYVGTVGGQATTAVLQWQTPDSATGSFYLHRGGPEYGLSFNRARPGPALVEVANERGGEEELDQGTWQLTAPSLASPTLAGTWRRAGHSQRLLLRESYAGALRYTFKKRILFGDARVPENCAYVPTVQHMLLTLPSPLAAPPALRAQVAGSPAALRRRVQEDVTDGDASAAYRDEVRLNDFQLFSYQTSYYDRSYGGTPDTGTQSWLFDLRTGQELAVADQLKLGYERPLRRLLTRHLRHDPALADARTAGLGDWADEQGRPSALANLPTGSEALTLTGAGLEATYSPYTLVLIPYRELRPLVRPGTPLARMLRARGLWQLLAGRQ